MIEAWRHFHQKQGDPTHMPYVPTESAEWPDSWKKTHYKAYDRLPRIPLHPVVPLELTLSQTLTKRSSQRNFVAQPMPLQKLAPLLHWSIGENNSADHRYYASGGARYPIEVYLVSLYDGADLSPGVYHYNFKENALDVLWQRLFSDEERAGMCFYPWAANASVMLIMTGVFHRTIEKYGERGYRFSLIEAGHIGQNILLSATALDLRATPLGAVNERFFEKLLDIDPRSELIVYAMALGV